VKRRVNVWNEIDKISIFLYLLMVIMGWVNIYAAVYNEEYKDIFDLSQRYGKQFIWILAAIIMAIFVVIIDNRFYLFFASFVYALLIFLLMLVLVIGKEVNGARSWFEFGPVNLQPSEFAKFATSLALANFLNNHYQELRKAKVIITAVALILLPALLIAMQPDMGTTIIFFSFLIVLFREGMSMYIFVSGLLMLVLFLLTLLINNLYIEAALIILAFLLIWVVTKKLKFSMSGLGIFIFISGLLFVLNYYFIKSLGNELIIILSLISSIVIFRNVSCCKISAPDAPRTADAEPVDTTKPRTIDRSQLTKSVELKSVSVYKMDSNMVKLAGKNFLNEADDPLVIEVIVTERIDPTPRASSPAIVLNGQNLINTRIHLVGNGDRLIAFLPDRKLIKDKNSVAVVWLGNETLTLSNHPLTFKATDIVAVANPVKSASGLEKNRRLIQISESVGPARVKTSEV